ncbi:NYN domain-containing protein [Chloroflexota bacterium]
MERIMIFIDGSNLYHSLKKIFGRTDLDIGRFCNKLIGRRKLARIYYYNAKVGMKEEPERYRHQQAFFTSINAIPYSELRLGRLVYNNWPNVPPFEKGIDVQLTTDMLTHGFKNNYDVAILVAGDNDFVGALQAVKDNGKHVEVALFGREGSSHQLRRVADKIVAINSRFLKGCWKSQQINK